jgi:internalin A
MTDHGNPVSRPWRRSLRFSVRGLIALVLIIGVWFGWIVRSARIQREAVAAITRTGGFVRYDWEFKNGHYDSKAQPVWPKRLVDLIGADYVGSVTEVFGDENFKPALAAIGNLETLEVLDLDETTVTDAGIENLGRLKKLRNLSIQDTAVSDAALVHVKGLRQLTSLNVGLTEISDVGLANLQGLTNLEHLLIHRTKIRMAGRLTSEV